MSPEFLNPSSPREVALQSFIQRVYQWMAAGLGITALTALWAASTPAVLKLIAGPGFWVAVLAEIGIVIWLSAAIHKISAQTAVLGFLAYSAINGLTMAFIFLIYTGSSIASTFFITAATFAGVSFFGWITKANLASLRGFLFMGLFGVILGSLANFFMQSAAFDWILTYLGLAVFIGLTAYDTQKLKEIHAYSNAGAEQMAVIGALRLYLDFVNMFLLLLRLFGRRR